MPFCGYLLRLLCRRLPALPLSVVSVFEATSATFASPPPCMVFLRLARLGLARLTRFFHILGSLLFQACSFLGLVAQWPL